MKFSLLNEIFDRVISEKRTDEENVLLTKVVQKYKKSNMISDETELTNDLCELVYYAQKNAFRVGFLAALDLMQEK